MNATLGQIVLLTLVIGLGVYVFVLRSVLSDRIIMLALAAVGVVLIAWPGLSSDLAGALGIGRGTDLVFYLFILFCLFRFVSAAAATHQLERRLTLVVRELALRDARSPEPPSGATQVAAAAGDGPAHGVGYTDSSPGETDR